MAPEDGGYDFYLEIDGAKSHAMVWVNGNFASGWLFGYNSFRADLTPYIDPGNDNQLSIRLDNPIRPSRWYPGSSLYRNSELVKVDGIHVAHWGTFVTAEGATAENAVIQQGVEVENNRIDSREIQVITDLYVFDYETRGSGEKMAEFSLETGSHGRPEAAVNTSVTVENPHLCGPPPMQEPKIHVVVTQLVSGNQTFDTYETRFGASWSMESEFTYGASTNTKTQARLALSSTIVQLCYSGGRSFE